MTARTRRAGAGGADPELEDPDDENTDPLAKHNHRRKSARHAEIARRYRRGEWRDQQKPDRIKSVRREQIVRVLRDRHAKKLSELLASPYAVRGPGGLLSDDRDGRGMLQLLFELGLTGPAAQALAPWAAADEVARLIAAAEDNRAAWARDDGQTAAERIGDRIELTFEEFKRLRLTHIRPCDAQRHEVDEYSRERRAERDRDWHARRRARPEQRGDNAPMIPSSVGGRAKSIFLHLRGGHWRTIRELAEHFAPYFELDHAAARQAVLRAVKELAILEVIETKTVTGPRGLPVLHARRPFTAAEIEAEHQELMRELAAEQGEESDAGV